MAMISPNIAMIPLLRMSTLFFTRQVAKTESVSVSSVRGVSILAARYPEKLQEYARALRSNQTQAEAWLWKMLRAHRFSGFKFRRQVPIGPFIVDFYCHQRRLVLELDGGQHNQSDALDYDRKRSDFLRLNGLHVVRFWNNDVLQQKESVLQKIWSLLNREPSPDFG